MSPSVSPTVLLVDDNASLVNLLSRVLGKAGYHVVSAGRGDAALAALKNNTVQLALVDLVLPDMTGYHLVDLLRGQKADLPIVFVTGAFKGESFATEAKIRYGVLGYFEKPFDGRKLLTLVQTLLPVVSKAVAMPTHAESPVDLSIELELEEDAIDFEPVEPMELTGRIRVHGHGVMEPHSSIEARAPHLVEPPFTPVVRKPAIEELPVILGSPFAEKEGELHDNLPHLFNAFYTAKETGELVLQRGPVKKVVYFEKGFPVFALSNVAADRFGTFLVRVGKVKAEQLTDSAQVAADTGRRTGDVLIERGLLKQSERLFYVAQQVKAILYSLFAWESGHYALSFREKALAEPIKLDVHPGNLIIRGVKKLYKPERLARMLPNDQRLRRSETTPYELKEIELDKWETQLLEQIDGQHTNGELCILAQKPEHQTRSLMAALMGLEILV